MTKKACGRLLYEMTWCKLVLFTDICSWNPDYPKWGCGPNPFLLRNLSLWWIFNILMFIWGSMKRHHRAELGLFQHCPKGRFPMNRGLYFARTRHGVDMEFSRPTQGPIYALKHWNIWVQHKKSNQFVACVWQPRSFPMQIKPLTEQRRLWSTLLQEGKPGFLPAWVGKKWNIQIS